ncbi:calcium-binding protein [Massilia sp. CCM 9210]|uniref:calcium-binding protein n=1 Tax=Massilia scottii TaxID=3057166 RepID=UPI002796AEDE|nr:calcium-binding protein [Massilia sp. CCM 9210]MDQ1816479.1 calcium-binding protein [Massilia sp. CCM 9210]
MNISNAFTERHADLASSDALQTGPNTTLAGVGLNLQGGSGADALYGSEFDDTISGNGGDDTIRSGAGNDTVLGGDGADVLYTGDGDDRIEGGEGDDEMAGGAGSNTLLGGDGADLLYTGDGDDRIEGGEGDDRMDGGSGSNTMLGGAGNDTLAVNYGGDSLLDGGDGNDSLWVGDDGSIKFGTVQLFGGAGDDSIVITDAASAVTVNASGGSGHDTFRLSLYEKPASVLKMTLTDFSVGADSDLLDLYLPGIPWNYTGNPFGADGYLRLEQRGADTILRFDGDGAAGSTYAMFDVLTLRNVVAASLTSAHFKQGYDPAAGFFGRVLTGTAGADSIKGDARAEHLIGLGGNDTLLGAAGNDLVEGGDDGDLLQGGAGNDSMFGGTGDDTLAGEEGNDSMVGGGGKDVMTGGAGDDYLNGDKGDDILTDAEGNNVLTGGEGDDVIVSTGSGSDKVDGGDGSDTITGGAGDTLDGGFGENHLFADFAGGAKGTVRMLSGWGDDVLTFGPSLAFQNVVASGGHGADTFLFASGAHAGQVTVTDFDVNDVFDLDALIPQVAANYTSNPFGALGYLRVQQHGNSTELQFDEDGAAGSAAGFRTILTIDAVLPSQLTASHIVGGMNPNGSEDGIHLSGWDYEDILNGGRSNDVLDGGQGADVLYGFRGNDVLRGGFDNDTLHGGEGDDQLGGDDGDDVLRGGAGDDALNGGDGNDALHADTGDDVLDGGAGNDTLDGGSGSVQLNGGNGNDVLKVTGSGNSGLFGGRGADVIEIAATQQALAGRVLASGGEGADTIVFTRGALDNTALTASGGAGIDTYMLRGEGRLGSLTVKDFTAGAGGDRIDLSGLAAPAGVLAFVQSGSATLVRFDLDGAAGPLAAATLMTLQNVPATSITSDNVVDVGGAPVELVGLVGLVGIAPAAFLPG